VPRRHPLSGKAWLSGLPRVPCAAASCRLRPSPLQPAGGRSNLLLAPSNSVWRGCCPRRPGSPSPPRRPASPNPCRSRHRVAVLAPAWRDDRGRAGACSSAAEGQSLLQPPPFSITSQVWRRKIPSRPAARLGSHPRAAPCPRGERQREG